MIRLRFLSRSPTIVPHVGRLVWARRNAMGNLRKRLARKLIALRGDKSQSQYARETGLSKSTLSRLEAGEQNTTLDSLETLCRKLRIDILDLFQDED